LDDLSNSGRPFDYIVKAGQPARPKTLQENGEIMTQYLVAIHHPDDYGEGVEGVADPSAEDEAMSRDIDALNDEMVAAGVRIFVGGLSPASSPRSLRARPEGSHHRRAVPGDQGAHRRFLGAESR